MAATKRALEIAYDAGQAAQRDHLRDDVCPFPEGEERDAWLRGYEEPLAEKWANPLGSQLNHRIGDQ